MKYERHEATPRDDMRQQAVADLFRLKKEHPEKFRERFRSLFMERIEDVLTNPNDSRLAPEYGDARILEKFESGGKVSKLNKSILEIFAVLTQDLRLTHEEIDSLEEEFFKV